MNTPELHKHEKAGRMDAALRTERDNLRQAGGHLLEANALTSYLQNADEDSKARFYDLVMKHDTPAEALAELIEEPINVVTSVPVTWEMITNAWIGVIESGITSQWIGSVESAEDPRTATLVQMTHDHKTIWYAYENFWKNGGKMIVKYDDPDKHEDGEHSATKVIDRYDIANGLNLMAKNSARHFADLINENDDADTHDVLAQYIILGEIIYG